MQIQININDQDFSPTIEIKPDQVQPHPAQEIIEELRKTKSRHQVAECIWRSFGNLFMAEINAGGDDDYFDCQFDTWRRFCR